MPAPLATVSPLLPTSTTRTHLWRRSQLVHSLLRPVHPPGGRRSRPNPDGRLTANAAPPLDNDDDATPHTPSSAQRLGSGGPVRARDVVVFGREVGRVLSDGRIVGRAEPFAKVFASSRHVKRAVGATAWVILEDIALDATIDDRGRLVADTSVRQIADHLELNETTGTRHVARLREPAWRADDRAVSVRHPRRRDHQRTDGWAAVDRARCRRRSDERVA
jgi:hypothetical protein